LSGGPGTDAPPPGLPVGDGVRPLPGGDADPEEAAAAAGRRRRLAGRVLPRPGDAVWAPAAGRVATGAGRRSMNGQHGGDAAAREIATALTARGETVAVAETAAGGLISATLLAMPGASAWFAGGAVAYSTAAKTAWLDLA